MANDEHVALLLQGPQVWNAWRKEHADTIPDLQGADLTEAGLGMTNLAMANLTRANFLMTNLTGANLLKAELEEADFYEANLTRATLTGADLNGAIFSRATLSGADLTGAFLVRANFFKATLAEANLTGANLAMANFIEADLTGSNLAGIRFIRALLDKTNLTDANLTGCHIYGISAWNLTLAGAKQRDLIITDEDESEITVDDLEVAQFIYLLLRNEKIRDVIDTITSKVVLILGRFTPGRKAILDAIREELRYRNYVPILFDFEKPTSRDLTETISTLAHMARFIIADLTDAKSLPQELQAIVPNLPGVPVQPLLQQGAKEYTMFEHFKRYPWVLPTFRYNGVKAVCASLKEKIIAPAEAKAKELLKG